MNKKLGRKSPIKEALAINTLSLGNQPAAAVAGSDADTLDGHHASDFLNPQYVVLAADTELTNERILANGTGIALTDGGAGANVTLAVDLTFSPTWTGTHTFSADPQLAANLDFVGARSITTTTGNLTVAPAGDIILDPTGNDILPNSNYDLNLGSISKKYLTLHAAELWVETLVAQETLATIGGRILVGPTTSLIADLSAVATSIDVKHNNLANGDRVVMEANGQLEWMAITSSATTITGGFRYNVTRNLDGSGANAWYAGDAVFNTGTTGDGFIDLYSLAGVYPGSTAGPTIVGNVRTSATYNAFTPYWAIGNLNGLYGYSGDTYGAAFGNYGGGGPYLAIDSTNGIIIFDEAHNEVISFPPSGNAEIVGSLDVTSPGEVTAGAGVVVLDANGVTIEAASSPANPNKIKFNSGATNLASIFTSYGSNTTILTLRADGPASGGNDLASVILYAIISGYNASYFDIFASDGTTTPYARLNINGNNQLLAYDGYVSIVNDARILKGLFVGDNIDPDDNDIHFSGNLKSYKGGTSWDVYATHTLGDSPATNTGWDGDDSKTTGTYQIDTSAWGLPAGVKMVLVRFGGTFGTASNSNYATLRPYGGSSFQCNLRATTTYFNEKTEWVNCDSNGDIAVVVAGATLTQAILEIYAYKI